MPQRPSLWRANDAALYDALRDEARLAVADLLASDDGQDEQIADRIAQLRSELNDVDGFDRGEVAMKLAELREEAGPSHD
ncbi:hypothetical protein [Microbacterium abyssi]|uniref:hypothetical protein n=1 Tax=Microbacterium abyssi TaxID=2782166 RepID=UPI0018895C50|nr:hypothetical protein [Microbacterium sp. A18JL241]